MAREGRGIRDHQGGRLLRHFKRRKKSLAVLKRTIDERREYVNRVEPTTSPSGSQRREVRGSDPPL